MAFGNYFYDILLFFSLDIYCEQPLYNTEEMDEYLHVFNKPSKETQHVMEAFTEAEHFEG